MNAWELIRHARQLLRDPCADPEAIDAELSLAQLQARKAETLLDDIAADSMRQVREAMQAERATAMANVVDLSAWRRH